MRDWLPAILAPVVSHAIAWLGYRQATRAKQADATASPYADPDQSAGRDPVAVGRRHGGPAPGPAPDTAEPMISDTSTHQAWPGQRYDRRGDNAFLFKLQNRADMGHRRTVEFWLTNTNSGSTSRNFSIWPESQPSETIDGGTYSSGSPFTIALPPGQHYVRLSRDGSDWKSFRK